MAARTRSLQLAIAVVNIVIAALVFTSIWPFPSGDIKIDLPSAPEVSWTFDDGVVHVTAPFSIDNGGFWDIEDLVVRFEVTNYSLAPLFNDTIHYGTIKVGDVLTSSLDFEFDLLERYNQGITWMVFNWDMLNFYVEVSCGYTKKLVKFDATYEVSVVWDPLVQSYGLLNDTCTYSRATTSGPVSVSIDYWLATSEILSSLPTAELTVNLAANSTDLSQTQTTIQLGGNYSDVISMDFYPHADPNATYSMTLTVEFGGFPPMSRTYVLPPLPDSILEAIP